MSSKSGTVKVWDTYDSDSTGSGASIVLSAAVYLRIIQKMTAVMRRYKPPKSTELLASRLPCCNGHSQTRQPWRSPTIGTLKTTALPSLAQAQSFASATMEELRSCQISRKFKAAYILKTPLCHEWQNHDVMWMSPSECRMSREGRIEIREGFDYPTACKSRIAFMVLKLQIRASSWRLDRKPICLWRSSQERTRI